MCQKDTLVISRTKYGVQSMASCLCARASIDATTTRRCCRIRSVFLYENSIRYSPELQLWRIESIGQGEVLAALGLLGSAEPLDAHHPSGIFKVTLDGTDVGTRPHVV